MELKIKYPKISSAITGLFNFYVFIWWLEVGKRIPFCGRIRLEFLVGAILSVLALYRYFSNPERQKHNSDIATAIIVYLLVLLASIPFAIDINVAWSTYVNRVFKFALMSFFISQFVTSPQTLRYFSFSSFLAFFKIGQEAFYGKVTGSMVWYNQGIPRLHGPPGTMFGHPNSLSGKTISLLPFLWYLFPVLKARWVKVLMVIQLIFSLNILIFTGSRTGYVTFFVMLFVLFILGQKKVRILSIVILVTILAVEFVPRDYKARFMSTFEGHEKEGHSKETRIKLLKDSFHVFLRFPQGVGLFCFPIIQAREGRNPQETHNLYTQILAETGIQGGICFSVMLFIIFKKILLAKKKLENTLSELSKIEKNLTRPGQLEILPRETADCKFMLALSNGSLLFLLVRMVLGLFGHDLLEIYWWIAAGFAMALTNMSYIHELRMEELTKRLFEVREGGKREMLNWNKRMRSSSSDGVQV